MAQRCRVILTDASPGIVGADMSTRLREVRTTGWQRVGEGGSFGPFWCSRGCSGWARGDSYPRLVGDRVDERILECERCVDVAIWVVRCPSRLRFLDWMIYGSSSALCGSSFRSRVFREEAVLRLSRRVKEH